MQTGHKSIYDIDTLIRYEKTAVRKKLLVIFAAAALIFFVSVCERSDFQGFYSPATVIENIKMWISLAGAKGVAGDISKLQAASELAGYLDTVYRVKLCTVTFVCGMVLAMAGMLFQNVFRNPIAAPTMLGVNTGVNLGIIALISSYGAVAAYMPFQKYIYCYTGAVIMLAAVLAVGKLSSGSGRFSVYDLLIAGAILSQIAGAGVTFYLYNSDNDAALVYQQISKAIYVDTQPVSLIFITAAAAVTLIPVYMARFSFNAVSFEDSEARSLGIKPAAVKITALILGTFMVTAGMVHCGSAGMVSLIVPFISRSIFGADFRKLFTGNILIGGAVLLLCRDIASFFPFGGYGLPIGTVVDFVAMPVFVIILVKQRRTWE